MVSLTHAPSTPGSLAAAAHQRLDGNPCAQYLIDSNEVVIAPGLSYSVTRGELHRRVTAWTDEPISAPAFKRAFNACSVYFGLMYVPDTHACIGGLVFNDSPSRAQPVGQRRYRLALRRREMVREVFPTVIPREQLIARALRPDSSALRWAEWTSAWFVRIQEHPDRFTPIRETDDEIRQRIAQLTPAELALLSFKAELGSTFHDWAGDIGLTAGGWIRGTLLEEEFNQLDAWLHLAQFGDSEIERQWQKEIDGFVWKISSRKPETVLRYMLDGSTHRDLPVPA